MEETFTTQNIDNLKSTCKSINAVLEENTDGSLMVVQLMALGEYIKEFLNNPIVKNSGIK